MIGALLGIAADGGGVQTKIVSRPGHCRDQCRLPVFAGQRDVKLAEAERTSTTGVVSA